jgi:hypothetical protein
MGYLVWLFMASVVLAFYDAYLFIQYNGNLKRGIKVGSSTLSSDKIQYFQNLKKDVTKEETKAFIRKEGQTVLIQPIPYFAKRTLGLWYVGLVDLSKNKPHIEFRVPVSAFIIGIILTSILVYQLFYEQIGNVIGAVCTLLFVFLFFIATRPFSKYVVIEYIEETMQEKRG